MSISPTVNLSPLSWAARSFSEIPVVRVTQADSFFFFFLETYVLKKSLIIFKHIGPINEDIVKKILELKK